MRTQMALTNTHKLDACKNFMIYGIPTKGGGGSSTAKGDNSEYMFKCISKNRCIVIGISITTDLQRGEIAMTAA